MQGNEEVVMDAMISVALILPLLAYLVSLTGRCREAAAVRVPVRAYPPPCRR